MGEGAMNSFYTEQELAGLGLKSFGSNVFISRKCSLYGVEHISLGDNVRIDDFCILSGRITLGSYIHISAYCALYGSQGITLSDFCGLSPRCTLLSASDDFSGEYMVGPMVPVSLSHVTGGRITLEKFVQIGTGCTLMPGITVQEGAVTGAMSLIHKTLAPWSIYAGIPATKIRERKKNILALAQSVPSPARKSSPH